MMLEQPRRRGRPPANPVDATPTEGQPTTRRRRASVGGLNMKLAAPPRLGFHRRFFNDDGNRIAQAKELGYEPVSDTSSQTSSSGSRDSRLVGTKANGEPLQALLMETPNELYAEGEAEREDHNRLVDEAISAGRDVDGNADLSRVSSSSSSIRR